MSSINKGNVKNRNRKPKDARSQTPVRRDPVDRLIDEKRRRDENNCGID